MRDYIAVITGKGISAVAQMVMLLILANQLVPEQLAVVLAVYAVASVVATLGDLGLGTLSMRERAYGDLETSNSALQLGDILARVVALSGLLCVLVVSVFIPALLPSVLLIPWGSVERATESRSLRLLADGKPKHVAALVSGRRVLGLGLFLILSFFVPVQWAFSIALFLAAVAAQYVMRRWVHNPVEQSALSSLRLLREALPFTFSSVAGQMRNLDVVIISAAFIGIPAAAYGLGARLASPFMLVFSSVASLVLVRVKELPPRRFRALVLVLLGASGAAVTLCITMSPLLEIVLSSVVPWMNPLGAQIIALVMSSYILAGASIVLGSICVAYRLERKLVQVNILTVAAALGTVLVMGLIVESALAAATGSLACYALQAIVLVILIARERRKVPRSNE